MYATFRATARVMTLAQIVSEKVGIFSQASENALSAACATAFAATSEPGKVACAQGFGGMEAGTAENKLLWV
jgi:hypothetical protein